MKVDRPLPIRILTHNIRYATSAPFRGEKPWKDRKQRLLNELHYHSCHNPETFICLQEVLHVQLNDILSGLNPSTSTSTGATTEWAYIGVGRDDGKQAGEYSPIFYRPAVWELEEFKTVWLSETPSVPSRGWDASSIRIVTIGVFKHLVSRKRVLGMSTHLDDQGSKSRYEAAKLILTMANLYLTKNRLASRNINGIFLAGDFNSEENQEAYRVLTAVDSQFVDAQKQVDTALRYGSENTYTGFGYEDEGPKRIDYVLFGPKHGVNPAWSVEGYAVVPNKFDDGVLNSDHRAVVADAELF
ncbi:endonuclease/exonuclease/phosphatase [Histoplasma capsulatum H143]|uniref:Endonuclease/exonuclease/phosphatase n=1 Tax=Ajellomyces capsulatus (strain H143) TaxID=544712 RepID=C6HBZ6_AJECH|nr:endonuclease/exonuclease/phosphatase [Histoplasma capsulatum H143]